MISDLVRQTCSGTVLPAREACRAVGLSEATYYRALQSRPSDDSQPTAAKQRPSWSLSEAEREAVLNVLNEDRFVDQAPAAVYATLLDEGRRLCSTRTMYRILAANQQVRERRNQLRHPKYSKPELLAQRPNEVWTWDITKLRGPYKAHYYYLYVIIDIFSRYVVGWSLARSESGTLAQRLIDETCTKHTIPPGQLYLHADRGPSMKSYPVAQLLANLGVTKSHSRPHTSDDNPYSESHFKTLKYRPNFPQRFRGFEEALSFCKEFFDWYNKQHYHSGIAYLTPSTVHYGVADSILTTRHHAEMVAYCASSDRFRNGPPKRKTLPPAVWINPPENPEPYIK